MATKLWDNGSENPVYAAGPTPSSIEKVNNTRCNRLEADSTLKRHLGACTGRRSKLLRGIHHPEANKYGTVEAFVKRSIFSADPSCVLR